MDSKIFLFSRLCFVYFLEGRVGTFCLFFHGQIIHLFYKIQNFYWYSLHDWVTILNSTLSPTLMPYTLSIMRNSIREPTDCGSFEKFKMSVILRNKCSWFGINVKSYNKKNFRAHDCNHDSVFSRFFSPQTLDPFSFRFHKLSCYSSANTLPRTTNTVSRTHGTTRLATVILNTIPYQPWNPFLRQR